jgi:RimJ/RimL family protein N-acetyltransferase
MTSMDNFEPPAMYPVAKSEHFETERLLVRRIIEDDLESLIPILEDPDLAKWFGRNEPFDPQAFVNDAIAGWEAQASWAFTIIEKASQHVVGYAGISLELRGGGGRGWQAEPVIAIAPDSQGQGYAYETMPGLIGWCFTELDCPPGVTLDEVRAGVLPCNTKSLGLLRKLTNIGIIKDLGEQEVRVKHTGPGEPRTRIAHVFGITREEYGQEEKGAHPC